MSLYTLANHLESAGRGEDKVLVHMTPEEVQDLQDIAMASGGSLTINPHTGLYEAFRLKKVFRGLKKLLPLALTTALAPVTAGVVSPLTMGLIGTGITALGTGSLTKGLKTGVQAYAGSSLGAGLMNAGAGPAGIAQTAGLAGVSQRLAQMGKGITGITDKGGLAAIAAGMPALSGVAGLASAADAADIMSPESFEVDAIPDESLIRPYEFKYNATNVSDIPSGSTAEKTYFSPTFTALTPYSATDNEYMPAAQGGLIGLAAGGAIEPIANMNFMGQDMQYPMVANNIYPSGDTTVDLYGAEDNFRTGNSPYTNSYSYSDGGISYLDNYSSGGISHLGDYSDGGRLLRGPGDGVSDSIPARIAAKQPARLADGEFVVPARIVSELGNGSTEAGARRLYAMMDRVQTARKKSVGRGKVAVNSNAEKYLPA
jgi:hypothetical protein